MAKRPDPVLVDPRSKVTALEASGFVAILAASAQDKILHGRDVTTIPLVSWYCVDGQPVDAYALADGEIINVSTINNFLGFSHQMQLTERSISFWAGRANLWRIAHPEVKP